MLKLVKPSKQYYKQYKEMMDEWNMEGSRIAPWPLHLKYHTEELFEEMLNRVQEVEEGNNLGEFASSTTYWLYDDENDKLIGASNLRHYLTEEGLKLWGHIGYGIRPSERNKGYATDLLKMTLKEAKKYNIDHVLLGAYTGNIGSWRVMERCGGKFENIVIEDETGLPVKRYWISLKKRYADRYGGNRANADLKTISVKNQYFNGDICFYNFIEVKDKILIPNGKCIMDNNYKWLEFYDYSSKIKLTAIYDENNEIIEWYFDIAREVGKENEIPYEDDLYLDVVVTPKGDIILLDEDELKQAYDRKEITKEEYENAYKEAEELMSKLKNNKDKLKEYTDKYLKKMLGVIK
ncbi:MAG TPA: hypothetical protein DCZ30_07830 [Clostridiales bacterium]|nr:hypothetical protein [Clostridiales bacterium]